MTPTAELARAVREGDRRALARAITLVESTRADHRDDAVALLEAILPATGAATRVGISGAPGAGKSTFIETLGVHLVDAGHRVAVLAVDPSSARSGGSILGDKTRMEQLSRRAGGVHPPVALGRNARRRRAAHPRGVARVRGRGLRRRAGRDRRRRPVGGRGRGHGRPVRAAARAGRGRRAPGREAGHRRARRSPRGEQGRRRPAPTSPATPRPTTRTRCTSCARTTTARSTGCARARRCSAKASTSCGTTVGELVGAAPRLGRARRAAHRAGARVDVVGGDRHAARRAARRPRGARRRSTRSKTT